MQQSRNNFDMRKDQSMKTCKPEYLEKVLILSTQEKERLQSRMTGKLPRKLERRKINADEALALQLEFEDKLLNEWRERMHELKAKEVEKAAKATKSVDKSKVAPEEKAAKQSVKEQEKRVSQEQARLKEQKKKQASAKDRLAKEKSNLDKQQQVIDKAWKSEGN
jgi:hypothetical protein